MHIEWNWLFSLLVFLMVFLTCSENRPEISEKMAAQNIIWDTPAKDSNDSMPLGNGDIGLNAWVKKEDGLHFYLSKTDAWSENARLLKLGEVVVNFSPNPFADSTFFLQELQLLDGRLLVQAGEAGKRLEIQLWADAHNPVVNVEATADFDFKMTVSLNSWRDKPRTLGKAESYSAYGLVNAPYPVIVEPDHIVNNSTNKIIWYHRNERSIWAETMKDQGLESIMDDFSDPLQNRTFGGCIWGDNLIYLSATQLTSREKTKFQTVKIACYTNQTASADEWQAQLESTVEKINSLSLKIAKQNHQEWWAKFWERSWIFADGDSDAQTVTLGYTLQRWINACAGRGNFPIKFNGSLFTVDASLDGEKFDADFRRWGGPYWWQNTRLPYWSMLASGDSDLMKPLFNLYFQALELAEKRTRIYFDHAGVFFPETMYFWGAYTMDNYGWPKDRGDLPVNTILNRYIRYEWQGGLELTLMLLDWFDYFGDETFLKQSILPFAEKIIMFYDEHYPRTEDGTLRIWPGQALETYWDSENPAPEIAGLKTVLARLLDLDEHWISDDIRKNWQQLQAAVPELPMREVDGKLALGFAGKVGPKHNLENPELYAVWPYGLYGVVQPELEMARETYARRLATATGGWQQNAIQAAVLGLTDEARKMVVSNFTNHAPDSRFPAFWGPNYDWIPDQDNGGVSMIALQKMLLQTVGDQILLFPAWPAEWDVSFKLHAPGETTICGELRNGELLNLQVEPASRKQDIKILLPERK